MLEARTILEKRAAAWQRVRAFFAARGVLEVDTPILAAGGNPDPHLPNMQTQSGEFLHTSPEFAMKALLSQGSGDIFQLCHVFRAGEYGRQHRPEFMLLEWYRLGWNHRQLMEEVYALILEFLPQYRGISPQFADYEALFQHYLQLDIHGDTSHLRRRVAERLGQNLELEHDGYLDLLFSLDIQPHLGQEVPVFVQHYPPSQAALARIIEHQGRPVAARFELFIRSMELCNGFWELNDAAEQERRFSAENARRRALGRPEIQADAVLLAALRRGLPDCAGVALGMERLLMLQQQWPDMAHVYPELDA